MSYPPGARPGYRRTPLSAEERARGEANFVPFVAQRPGDRDHLRPGRGRPHRRNGMSILVLLLYSGYAWGKVAARFRSSTVPQ
jgi:hypothetical protein